MQKIGFGFLDRPGIAEQLRLVRRIEALGYSSVWTAETRLVREAPSVLGAFAQVTQRITIGGIINSWTRGPALVALTLATLDEMAPDAWRSASVRTGIRWHASKESTGNRSELRCVSS